MLVYAEEKPIDIWNLEKKQSQTSSETSITNENLDNNSQKSIYNFHWRRAMSEYHISL